MRRARDDRGVAAVEMALVSGLVMLLAFGGLPLFAMMRAYQKVTSASADTLRFATSLDANPHVVRTNADGSQVISRRPTRSEIQSFADTATGDGAVTVSVTVYAGTSGAARTAAANTDPIEAQSGDTVVVVVKRTVDLSLLGSVANAAAALVGQGDVFPQDVRTITSTASGREE